MTAVRTRRTLGALWRARSGVSALEFAILAPALAMLSLGTLEYGRLIWTTEALTQAATEGARCMGVLATSCASGGVYSSTNTQSYVSTLAGYWSITLPTADITLSRTASCAGIAGFSQVSISYTFQTVLPLTLTDLSTSVPINATACFPNNS
jgi:Flp pilus assembly protein TadG